MANSMDEKLERWFNKIKRSAKIIFSKFNENAQRSPTKTKIAAIAIILIIVFMLLFKHAIDIIMNIIILSIIFAITIYVVVKMFFGKPSAKELMRKKKQLLFEIDLIEKKFMKRQIDEKTFTEYTKEKQKELIEIETDLDSYVAKQQNSENAEQFNDISARKRHILEKLFGEKEKIITQMNIAERKYLKRKIDEKMYQAIVSSCQAQLAKIEAQIKTIYSDEGVDKIMKELKENLKTIEQEIEQHEEKKDEAISETLMDSIEEDLDEKETIQ